MIPESQKQLQHRRFLRKRLIIALVGLTICAVGTIFWILSAGLIISGDWSYILPPIFTFFGLVVSLLAWLFPISVEPATTGTAAQPNHKQSTFHKTDAPALSSEIPTAKEGIVVKNIDYAVSLNQSRNKHVEVGQPTVEHPGLLCFAIDVSNTMVDSVVDHTGKAIQRWANIQTVLDHFIYLGTAIVKDTDTRKVLPLYYVMAYGFGFTEVAYQFRINKQPGGPVRDLLNHPSLSKFPSAAQITDHWNEYKEHITSRKYTPDLLGDTPMCQALAIIRDRIQEELTHKDFTLPILLLIISDGNSTDGDPLPIIEVLHAMGVLTLCCFLGNQDILYAKRLYEAERQQWTEEAKLMYRMASVLRNDSYITRAMFAYLEETGWHPQEGVRLFAQINHTEALDSFLKILLSGFMHERQA
jgi:hypothetical protein